MHKNLHNLLSDAVEIQAKTPQEQERIIADLHAEIESNNRKIAALNAQGGMLGSEDSAMMLRMMQVLSSARQCCPQCQAAQMPMPQMNFSCCSAPQPVSSAMTAIVPFRAAPQPAMLMGMFDNGLGDEMLVQGAKGAEVRRLQSLLRIAGYSVKVDGDFGQKTEDALVKFQTANGLRGDGRAKEADWQKLQEVAGKKSGATSRAEAGKNTVPTVREKVADASDTLIRVGAPVITGLTAAAATYFLTHESNIPKKAILCVASGLGTTALSYIGINALADKLSASPEETAVVA